MQPAAQNGKRQLWADMADDVSVTIKRIETFEHKRMRVATSCTGGELKQMIAAVWAMEQSEQMLIINGGVVGDDETLDAYNITDNTVVHLGWKQHTRSTRNNRLIVKNGQVTCYMIMWNSHDTTDFIRDRIAEKAGIIETRDITMTHGNGTVLLNGLLLRSCNLKHDDTITWGLNQNLPVCLPDAGGFRFAMLGRTLPVCLPDAGGFSFADPSGVKAPLPTPCQPLTMTMRMQLW